MEWTRSKRKLLILPGLLLVIWLNHNQLTNWHYHIMSNGAVVMHAHPYKSNTFPDTPFQKHQHNSFEYLFFSLIFNAIPLLIALLVLGLLFRFKTRDILLLPDLGNREPGFWRNLLMRGPPVPVYQ